MAQKNHITLEQQTNILFNTISNTCNRINKYLKRISGKIRVVNSIFGDRKFFLQVIENSSRIEGNTLKTNTYENIAKAFNEDESKRKVYSTITIFRKYISDNGIRVMFDPNYDFGIKSNSILDFIKRNKKVLSVDACKALDETDIAEVSLLQDALLSPKNFNKPFFQNYMNDTIENELGRSCRRNDEFFSIIMNDSNLSKEKKFYIISMLGTDYVKLRKKCENDLSSSESIAKNVESFFKSKKIKFVYNLNNEDLKKNSDFQETLSIALQSAIEERNNLTIERMTDAEKKEYLDVVDQFNHYFAMQYLILKAKNEELFGKDNQNTYDIILRTHEILTDTLTDVNGAPIGGTIRNKLTIRVPGSVVPYADDYEVLDKKVRTLIDEYVKLKNNDPETIQKYGKMNPIQMAICFSSEFVGIHPFVDGNGRMSRLLLNAILVQNNLYQANIKERDKDIYYDVVDTYMRGKKDDKNCPDGFAVFFNGNSKPFEKYILKLLKEQTNGVLVMIKKDEEASGCLPQRIEVPKLKKSLNV